jgi:hypothetical protein
VLVRFLILLSAAMWLFLLPDLAIAQSQIKHIIQIYGGSLSRSSEDGKAPVEQLTVEEQMTKTEWFALRVGGGLYGGGGEIELFTLRWEHFFWTIARAGAYFGGPPQLEKGHRLHATCFGMNIGYPWRLTDSGKHELRFSLAVIYALTYSGNEVNVYWVYATEKTSKGEARELLGSNCESEDGHNWTCSWIRESGFDGLAISPEIAYIWHQSTYFALQAGFALYIYTVDGKLDSNTNYRSKTLFPLGFVGFRT